MHVALQKTSIIGPFEERFKPVLHWKELAIVPFKVDCFKAVFGFDFAVVASHNIQ